MSLIEMRRPPTEVVIWSEALLSSPKLPVLIRRNILRRIGRAFDHQSQNRRALECFVEALGLSRQLSDREIEGELLSDVGSTTAAMGDYRTAITYQEQALVIACELGNRRGESQALMCIGMEYRSLGINDLALEYFHKALSIDRAIVDHEHERAVVGEITSTQIVSGWSVEHLSIYENALKVARERGNRFDEVIALFPLALLSKDSKYIEQAMTICYELNLRRRFLLLGDLWQIQRESALAIECYTIGLSVAKERNDVLEELKALLGLADASRRLGNIDRVIGYLRQALPTSRMQNRSAECRVLHRLSDAYDELGSTSLAAEFLDQALAVFLELPTGPDIIEALREWMEFCEDALILDAQNTRAMAKKGAVLTFLTQTDRGLAYLARSIELNTADPNLFYLNGIILAAVGGNRDDAVKCFNESRRLGLFNADARISNIWSTIERRRNVKSTTNRE